MPLPSIHPPALRHPTPGPGSARGAAHDGKALSPAFELLLACCRHPLTEEDRLHLGRCLAEDVDWDAFLALVDRHRIHPQVLGNLSAMGTTGLPEPVLQSLSRKVREHVPRAFGLLQDLLWVIPALQAAHIPVLVLKGPPLSLERFGDVTYRFSKDLDLLVPMASLRAAMQCLESMGCRRTDPEGALSPRQLRRVMAVAHHVVFCTPGGRILELHARADHEWGIPGFLQGALASPTLLPMGAVSIPVPGPGDHLLYLLVHGARHYWSRLKWLCDVEACLKQDSVGDWEAWLAGVRALRLEGIVAEGLFLARHLLGAPLPVPLAAFLVRHPPGQTRFALKELLDPTEALAEAKRPALRLLGSQWHRWRSRPSLRCLANMVMESFMGVDAVMAYDLPLFATPLYFFLGFPHRLPGRKRRVLEHA